MSKFLIICSVLVFASINFAFAQDHIGFGRPGDNNRPQRPGPQRPGQRVVFQTVDTYRVQKVIETTNTTRVNAPNVKQVMFTAQDNSVEIVEARLLLDNGREVFMDGMTGGLGQNRSITYTLDGPWGERVQSITVRAVSRSLLGSRPSLQVSVGVFQ
ncbi:MAG: hypothetical protein H7177_01145 [Rhizobacter sp.]|nr:hypothetical protein [Bacteriovorax sp.]